MPIFFGNEVPTQEHPAYVYEIEINEPIPPELKLLDPIKELAPILPSPLGVHPPYQHDGGPAFLLGVVDPVNMRKFLTQHTHRSHLQVLEHPDHPILQSL